MPRTKISEFSSTPASNTDIDSINISEGCAPSGINDAIRELMAQLKDFQTGAVGDSFNGPVGTSTAAAGAFTTLAASGAVTLSGGTANGVAYLNGSKVVTSGATLTYGGSGTNLSIGNGTAGNFEVGTGGYGLVLSMTNVGPKNAIRSVNNTDKELYINDSAGGFTKVITYIDGAEATRLTSTGLGIGTSSPNAALELSRASADVGLFITRTGSGAASYRQFIDGGGDIRFNMVSSYNMRFFTADTERARIDSSGNLLVGTTNADPVSNNVAGISLEGPFGSGKFSRSANPGLDVNRISNDGELVRFFQDGTQEGNISVSGTTVSYNGGHLSRYAQTTTSKDESLVKGTVLSNLDEMSVYVKDGQPVANEQLNKVKVSDVEGDANVAGVFVNWTHDDAHDVDEINMAMTGDMIIRIAQGTTVQRGDLLMSAGNGTAKPQGDDIVRSKTVAKVTSTHVTCTYADGSYCVPCVLMAC